MIKIQCLESDWYDSEDMFPCLKWVNIKTEDIYERTCENEIYYVTRCPECGCLLDVTDEVKNKKLKINKKYSDYFKTYNKNDYDPVYTDYYKFDK